jgi:hypothetical protein
MASDAKRRSAKWNSCITEEVAPVRPHVELIHEDDYIWHGAELIGGEGRASERRLSVDEEDGSSSLRVDFHTDWGRGPGIHHANTEYYVLEGSMTYGGRELGKGAYVYAPNGVPTAAITFSEGSRILHYREYGDAGFDAVDSMAAPRWDDAREDVIVLDSEAMNWDAVPNAGPMPGLFIKYLHIDPLTGFYTRLVHSQEGWADHRLAHHPCYEEAYTTQGLMEYNFGTLDLGTYFFRPARIKHGHFTSLEGGATWLLRSDGELRNWYTQNEWVRWGGEAINYGEGDGMRWSQSSHDLAERPTRRSAQDLETLRRALQYQRELGANDDDYVPHGQGADASLKAIAKALDIARLQGGHTGERPHGHDQEHEGLAVDWGADPAVLEHRDERTDAHAYNRGRGRPWKEGDPIPGPIISSLPVRSRSRGRWDGDGM